MQGGAFDDFLATAAPASRNQPRWREEDGPLPALYLGHGAPPLFNDPLWISQLFGWSQSLPKPRAVLIVSAHWESAPLALSASAAGTPLVYDFGGFDRRFFTMTYRTPDAGALAAALRVGRSSGLRLVIRLPSTTTCSSTKSPLALRTSVHDSTSSACSMPWAATRNAILSLFAMHPTNPEVVAACRG